MNPLFPELDKKAVADGERRRDRALQQVEGGTPPGWAGWARLAVRYVAERRERFTTDAVWSVLESWQIPPPPEPRALGPLMKSVVTTDWCEPTGEYVQSAHSANHRRPIAIYRSHLYRRKSL